MRDKQPASHTLLLEGSQLVRRGRADVFRQREHTRMKKIIKTIVIVGLIDVGLYRLWASGFHLGLPKFGPEAVLLR